MITKPKGTYDLLGTDARIHSYINETIERFMNSYNYDLIRTPIFEATELFHRSVGEGTDIVSKETYDFKDRGDRMVTLRPEGTAGVVRSYIENKMYGNRNDTVKLYYNGTMYRYERPQSGRFREFTQFGVETFGSNDPMIDAEVISIGYNLIKELGIENIVVSLNTLGDKETRENYTKALKDYLKPHLHELCEDCQNRYNTNPLRIIDCKYDHSIESGQKILDNVPKISEYLSEESKERFKKLKELLTMMDIDYEIDESIVRGLDYYDENVWEYKNADGVALGGGGRYNHLIENLGGPYTPAVGFAIGIERLILEIKKFIKDEEASKNIDVFVMSVNEEEKIHALTLSQDLRLNGLATEINSNNLSIKSQFKLADTLNAKFLVILNSEDLQKGLVNIKDNATKEEIKVDEKEVIDYLISNI